MIKLEIKTDGKHVYDSYDDDNPTLQEVALTIYRLDQIKRDLLSIEFESEFEVRKEN